MSWKSKKVPGSNMITKVPVDNQISISTTLSYTFSPWMPSGASLFSIFCSIFFDFESVRNFMPANKCLDWDSKGTRLVYWFGALARKDDNSGQYRDNVLDLIDILQVFRWKWIGLCKRYNLAAKALCWSAGTLKSVVCNLKFVLRWTDWSMNTWLT